MNVDVGLAAADFDVDRATGCGAELDGEEAGLCRWGVSVLSGVFADPSAQ
jgi:hypothetical protein